VRTFTASTAAAAEIPPKAASAMAKAARKKAARKMPTRRVPARPTAARKILARNNAKSRPPRSAAGADRATTITYPPKAWPSGLVPNSRPLASLLPNPAKIAAPCRPLVAVAARRRKDLAVYFQRVRTVLPMRSRRLGRVWLRAAWHGPRGRRPCDNHGRCR
jgi:hypothetical protein